MLIWTDSFIFLLPDCQLLSELSCRLNFNLKQRGDLLPCATSPSTTRGWGAHVGRRRAVGIWGPSLEGNSFRAQHRGTNAGVGPRNRPWSWSWGTFVGHWPLVRSRKSPKVTRWRSAKIPRPCVCIYRNRPRRGGEEADSRRRFRERIDALLLQLLNLLLILRSSFCILCQHLEHMSPKCPLLSSSETFSQDISIIKHQKSVW